MTRVIPNGRMRRPAPKLTPSMVPSTSKDPKVAMATSWKGRRSREATPLPASAWSMSTDSSAESTGLPRPLTTMATTDSTTATIAIRNAPAYAMAPTARDCSGLTRPTSPSFRVISSGVMPGAGAAGAVCSAEVGPAAPCGAGDPAQADEP